MTMRRYLDLLESVQSLEDDEFDLAALASSDIRHYLEMFQKFGKELVPSDIGGYTIASLKDAVAPFDGKMTKNDEKRAYAEKMKKESEVVYDSANYRIVVPKTEEASCFYGRGTKWCTAASNDNKFHRYKDDDLNIITDKRSGEKWQFYFKKKELNDDKNDPIKVERFWKEHSELQPFFNKLYTNGPITICSNDYGYIVEAEVSSGYQIFEYLDRNIGVIANINNDCYCVITTECNPQETADLINRFVEATGTKIDNPDRISDHIELKDGKFIGKP